MQCYRVYTLRQRQSLKITIHLIIFVCCLSLIVSGIPTVCNYLNKSKSFSAILKCENCAYDILAHKNAIIF